jgi:hypothetical protein
MPVGPVDRRMRSESAARMTADSFLGSHRDHRVARERATAEAIGAARALAKTAATTKSRRV